MEMDKVTEDFLMGASIEELRAATRARQEALRGENLLTLAIPAITEMAWGLGFLQAELARRNPRDCR